MHADPAGRRARVLRRAAEVEATESAVRRGLAASVFSDVEKLTVEYERTRTVEELIGFAYSTSFASPVRVAGRRDEFERELRARLKPVYHERVRVDAFLGGGVDE